MSFSAWEHFIGIIDNLPVILASSTAFFAGLYGYLNNLPNIRVYQNMSLFLIVFYIIGTLVKRTTKTIWEEHQEKAALLTDASLLLDDGSLHLDADGAIGGGGGGGEQGAGGGDEYGAGGSGVYAEDMADADAGADAEDRDFAGPETDSGGAAAAEAAAGAVAGAAAGAAASAGDIL